MQQALDKQYDEKLATLQKREDETMERLNKKVF